MPNRPSAPKIVGLVITPYFYPHPGGSQKYIEDLYAQLVKDQRATIDILCYNTDHCSATESYRGMSIHRVPCWEILPGQFSLPNYYQLAKKLIDLKKKRQYSFINSHTRFFDNSWWAPIAGRFLQCPIILTDHCASMPQHPSRLVTIFSNLVDHLLVPVITKWYTSITAVSEKTKLYLNSLGVKVDEVILAGVDLSLFQSQKRRNQLNKQFRLKISNSDVVITFHGRLIASKGVNQFLAIARKLTKKYHNIHFLIAGSGPLLSMAQTHQTDQIHYLGNLNRKQIADLLGSTDISVFASTHHEGIPLAALESAAAGCLILATKQVGLEDFFVEGADFLSIENSVSKIANTIESLMFDQQKIKSLGKNAKTKLGQLFNLSVQSKKLYSHIKLVTNQNNDPKTQHIFTKFLTSNLTSANIHN